MNEDLLSGLEWYFNDTRDNISHYYHLDKLLDEYQKALHSTTGCYKLSDSELQELKAYLKRYGSCKPFQTQYHPLDACCHVILIKWSRSP